MLYASSQSAEGFKRAIDTLDKENGNPIEFEKPFIVPMEEGAIEKLKRLSKVN